MTKHYDPYPILYKRTSTGKVQEWKIHVEGDEFWTVTGQQGGKQIVHARTKATPKNVGRANETTGEEQAILEAKAKWKKQTEKHYSQNVSDVDSNDFFKVMLAKGYDKRPADKIDWTNAYASPKLDGIRFVATHDHSHSRNGKPLGGGTHLRQQMDEMFNVFPSLILDGELYNHEFKDNFTSLVSMIKRDIDKPSFQDKIEEIDKYLEYHVYDVPFVMNTPPEAKDKFLNYCDRMDAFKHILRSFPAIQRIIKLVPYEKVNSPEEALSAYERFIGAGYEGGIIRFNLPYEGKRTWNLLKMKEFNDEEFEIVEVLEGIGAKAGTAGSLTMKLPDGTEFNSNIKGGFKVYDWLWRNRERMKGKSATIQFFGYSVYGIPRFPYAIKFDREGIE